MAEAIPTLEEAVTRKAAQSLLDEGNTLLTEVQTGYEEGAIENADVDGKIGTINTTCQKIYVSEELYTQLAASIDDLEEAIALAQSETTRVSASTLKRANLRLTQTQTQYDAGTIADDQIEGRIENINQLITDLTSSVQLYIDFGDAIAKLKTELDKEKKVSSSTLVAAQTLYNTATEAYNEGTIDDESIEAEITSINTAISNLQASATKYTSLYSAIGALKNTIDNNSTAKMSETTRENAQTLYENTLQAYEDGSLNDSQVDGKVTELNEMGTSVTASVALYTQLAESNSTLSNVIGEAKSKKVSKDLTNNAEQLNSTTASQYSDGSISDADATARITEINEMVNSLQTAIDNIPAFITGKFPSSGLATLATAYDLDFSSATGIEEAYVVSSVVNSSAKLTQVTEIPANSGVILKGQANAEYSIPVIFTATEQAQNLLKAAVEATAVGPNQVYILQGGSFHLVTKASTVPAGKAYLPVVDSENPARSISMYIDGKITGISTTSAADNLEDGKYLKNGKIFIVKNGKKINLDGIQVK